VTAAAVANVKQQQQQESVVAAIQHWHGGCSSGVIISLITLNGVITSLITLTTISW
jgi:uncharacterized membrane protein